MFQYVLHIFSFVRLMTTVMTTIMMNNGLHQNGIIKCVCVCVFDACMHVDFVLFEKKLKEKNEM